MTERNYVAKEIQEYPPILQAKHIMEITGFSNDKAYELPAGTVEAQGG